MRFRSFEWDEQNIDHIAKHGVTPDEAEEACFNDPLVRKSRFPFYIVLGQTDAGRYLTIIIIAKERGIVRVITARGMDGRERHRYTGR